MRGIKKSACLMLAFMMLLMITGCWNYREIDALVIVAGVAIDHGTTAQYKVTIELIQISHERDARTKPKIITSEGASIFDAVRDAISVAGKKLYWSHAKVIIVSQEVAKEGVAKILDWYTRDSETRSDVRLLVSEEKTAGEILTASETNNEIKSIVMHDIIKNEKNLAKAPDVQSWRFINNLTSPGVSPVTAAVKLKDDGQKKVPEVSGSAIFNRDEFIGFLDPEETFDMLFIQDMVDGGILVQKEQEQEGETTVSLEIFHNKTRIEPVIDQDNNASINIYTKTDVAIDEIQGTTNYSEDTMREKLEQDVENTLKTDLEDNIKRVQSEFGTDIYGFGNKIYQDYPEIWQSISEKWPELFKALRVNVVSEVHIRNSAMNSKTILSGA